MTSSDLFKFPRCGGEGGEGEMHAAAATDMFVEKCACRLSQGLFSLVLSKPAKPLIESEKIRGGLQ